MQTKRIPIEESARIYDAAMSCLESCKTIDHLNVAKKFAEKAMSILGRQSKRSHDFCSEDRWSIHQRMVEVESRLASNQKIDACRELKEGWPKQTYGLLEQQLHNAESQLAALGGQSYFAGAVLGHALGSINPIRRTW